MDAFPPPREPHYARLCAYLKPLLADSPAAPVNRVASVVRLFDAAALQRIERHLAGYIGPLARHLVKTAALQAGSVDDLVARLATELDTETERYEFTRQCRSDAPRA